MSLTKLFNYRKKTTEETFHPAATRFENIQTKIVAIFAVNPWFGFVQEFPWIPGPNHSWSDSFLQLL